MRPFPSIASFATGIALAASCSLAHAQATRTWVSGVGDDANPCSRTAPCKTFAGAISKTAAGGEINAIDPAGYGAVTITKAITIDGAGTHASILAAVVNGVIVNAGPNDVVTLRNLSINGIGTGFNGIRFIAGGALHVENVTAYGFNDTGGGANGAGLDFNPSTAAKLTVRNSSFRNNDNYGLLIRPLAPNTSAEISGTVLERNGRGLLATDLANVTIANSVVSQNAIAGVQAFSSGQPAVINLEHVTLGANGFFGARTDGAGALIRLSNALITGNGTGLSIGGGSIASFQNNSVAGNGVDGNPSVLLLPK